MDTHGGNHEVVTVDVRSRSAILPLCPDEKQWS